MDSQGNNSGPGRPMIPDTVSTKPRPPPPSLKPKPTVPKKPPVAAKPSLPHKPLAQNGGPPNASHPPAVSPRRPSCDTATPPTATGQSSDTASSPRSSPARPNKPPPPLPKTPPSAPPKAVSRNRDKSLSKTPPPLPKTPPRGSIKKYGSSSRQGSFDSPERQSGLDSTDKNLIDSTIKENHISRSKEALSERVDAVQDICDNNNVISTDDYNTHGVNDSRSKSRSPILPGKHTAKSRTPLRPTQSESKPSGQKIPLKPKPRLIDKAKHVNDDTDGSRVIIIDSDKGGSIWFAKTNDTEIEHSEAQIPNNSENKHIPKPSVQCPPQDITVTSTKSNSPSPSPPVRKKTLPKPPPKTKHLTRSTENISKPVDTQKDIDDSAKTSSEAAEHNDAERIQGTDSEKGLTKPTIDNIKIEEPKDSKKGPPTPTPRKPAPPVRPRPTPRVRSSSNRNSATFETCDDANSVQELSSNSTSEDVQISNSCDEHVGLSPDQNQSTDSATESDENVVTPRAKAGDDGEDTGIDHRNVVRSHSHITELEDDGEEVILRKKVASSTSFDIQDVPSVEELEFIFQNCEDEEDEVEGEADVEAENTCLSKDFGYDDKFLKFSGEITESANSDRDTNTKSSENESEVSRDGEHNVDVKQSSVELKGVEDVGNGNNSDEILEDKSLLEPTSLLNEIEDILTRSFKHSSLTRSGSSPEKTLSPYHRMGEIMRSERSRSVDVGGPIPVRPPRPKKEERRKRSMSQAVYDSCGSDTESLPDMSRGRLDSQSSNLSVTLGTLGKAKPHPPKPKRHKLLTVQRSQSDVTAMKSVVVSKSPNRRQTALDLGKGDNVNAKQNTNKSPAINTRPGSLQQRPRPTRVAPPPPPSKVKVTPPSPSFNLDSIVPVDNRVKSKNMNKKSKSDNKNSGKIPKTGQSSTGSYYHSIKDNDDLDSSEGDHDYQDIPDENELTSNLNAPQYRHIMKRTSQKPGKAAPAPPPQLPPRNMNNSHSFDNSSLSSAGHELDSVITGGNSSFEDMSISSECYESDVHSSGFKNPQVLRSSYPMTSSPYKLSKGLAPSNSSLSDSGGIRRPVSAASTQSDSWSGSHEAEQMSSSDSEADDEDKVSRKKEKKLFMIAKEVASSEAVFVDVLRLLNVDFRKHIAVATETLGRPVIPNDVLNKVLDYLPQLQNFNEELLSDLEGRIQHWEEKKCIADIFKKKGPFLKLFSSYILNFETMTTTLDESLKKYPAFQNAVKEFELSPRCACLSIKHYMLKPIQRIPQYRLLLQDYMNHLPPDCPEAKDMEIALAIVTDVAYHANENMRHEDYLQKMLEIQRSLVGQFEVIKPGRLFVKEGELMKLSRKEMQPRYFFLFNDVLLYTTPVATGYRLNNILALAGMKVSVSAHDEYKMEFSIISVMRSFTLQASSLQERDDWVSALNSSIDENAMKRNTFEALRSQLWGTELERSWDTYKSLLDKDFVLGHKAPLWIPDVRVTMCMICTCEFTVTFRRHHCRACGWVVCGKCSDNKMELRYLKYKPGRVCDKCFKTLAEEKMKQLEKLSEKSDTSSDTKADDEDVSTLLSLKNGLFERLHKIRRSGRSDKKASNERPDRLKGVAGTDEGACIKGYLHKYKSKKWKKKWFLIREKVLFTFKAPQDTAAASSMALLGYEVLTFTESFDGVEPELLFKLSHANMDPLLFKTENAEATQRWIDVMKESTAV